MRLRVEPGLPVPDGLPAGRHDDPAPEVVLCRDPAAARAAWPGAILAAVTTAEGEAAALRAGADVAGPPPDLGARVWAALRLRDRAADGAQDRTTGVPGRARMEAELPAFLARSPRPTAVALIDLDDFRRVNARHGHPEGDRALAEVAAALSGALRSADRIYRYGGEEFAVALVGVDEEGAAQVLARARAAVRAATARWSGGIGFSAGAITAGAPWASLLDRCDRALYRAKAAGGGTTCTDRARVEVLEVGPDDLPRCHAVRAAVFVQEQGVPAALERDGRDPTCAHVLATDGAVDVGAARLRPLERGAKVERVAVLRPWRGLGVGAALMRVIEERARRDGHAELVLHAQSQVVPFYLSLGWTLEGEPFDEAGIPHRRMRRSLAATPPGGAPG